MISERISDDMPPPIENFEYGYPHSNAFLQFRLDWSIAGFRKLLFSTLVISLVVVSTFFSVIFLYCDIFQLLGPKLSCSRGMLCDEL